MRALSAELLAEQKKLEYDGLWKAVFTKAGEDTQTFDRTRILDIDDQKQPYNRKATIICDNSDGELTDLELEGWQVVISYGMTTENGDEYSATHPMKVLAMTPTSQEDLLTVEIECIGIPNLLAEDRAKTSYMPEDDDSLTVKDTIDDMFDGTMEAFEDCPTYTVDWDSEDDLIDSYKPKDRFRIYKNGSRLAALRRLLDFTHCMPVWGADGHIHIINPLTSFSEEGWASPTSHSDPDSQWSDEEEAYNDATFEATTDGAKNFVKDHYLQLNIASLICTKIRINANEVYVDQGTPAILWMADLDIDIYYDSAWHNILSGNLSGIMGWQEYELDSPQAVTAVRIKSNSDSLYYTDARNYRGLFIHEFDFYGSSEYEILRPNAAGDTTELTPSAGSNYECVDEAEADDDTTYVHKTTSLDIDHYDLYNLPAHTAGDTQKTISMITVYFRCKYVNAGAGSRLAYAKIKTGGTEYDGDGKTLTTEYQTFTQEWATNPDTGVSWTWDDIDALQIGVRLVIPDHPVVDTIAHCTQVYVVITTDYNYEYSLADGEHPFLSRKHRKRLVIPNKIVCETPDDAEDEYSGSAVDSDSYDALGYYVIQYEECALESDDEGDDIAEALLSKYQMHAETGSVRVPMNVGAELFDYNKVTDSRLSNSRTGNLGIIHRRVKYDLRSQRVTRFDMDIAFGGWLSVRSQINNFETYPSGFGSAGQYYSRLFVKDLYAENIQADNIDMVWLDPDSGDIDLSLIGDDLDGLPDGTTYARIKALHLDAGQLKLDEYVYYADDYDPTDKFDLGDDDLDDIPDGATYERVRATCISAGYIQLNSSTSIKTGSGSEWYDVGYIVIDADVGITIGGVGSHSDLIFEYNGNEHFIYPSAGGLAFYAEDDYDFVTSSGGSIICHMDLDPASTSNYDFGASGLVWEDGYFEDIHVDNPPWDEEDDLELIKGIETLPNQPQKYDMSTVPYMLKKDYRKAEKIARRTARLAADEEYAKAVIQNAINNEKRPEKIAKLQAVMARVGQRTQEKLAAYTASFDSERESFSVANTIGLLLGAVKQAGVLIEAQEKRIAELESKIP